jgi:beta-lactamase regulating signal transducer with metallopeptidase domain
MRTFVEYGLANAVAATALAVLALLVGFVVRRPAIRNALWLLVFVRLLAPPVWTVPLSLPIAERSIPPADSPVSTAAAPSPEFIPEAAGLADTIPDWELDAAWLADQPIVEPAPDLAAAQPTATPAATEFALPPETYTILAVVWIAGSLFVLARSARRIYRFRRALRDALPAPLELQHHAEALARAMGLKRCPEVLLVPGRVWPSLWMPGLLARQAKLILPAGLVPLLDAGQRAAVLAHELAHLRRRDPWVRWLELIVCGLYWWHPLLGWFQRKLRESEEECCDLWVIAALCGRRAYATALVETAAYLVGPDSIRVPVLASGAGPVHNLQRRVTMIMRAKWSARLTRVGLAAVLGIGGLGLAFGPAIAQDRNERREPPAKEDPRPKDRERERERPKDAPREGERGRERASDKEIQEAREAAEKARKEAREAMARAMEAEMRLARLEGRPIPREGMPPGFPGFPGFPGRGPAERGAGDRGERPGGGDRGPGERGPMDPRRPGAEGGFPAPQLRELQQQIEELRRALDEMRREMRRGGEGGGDRPRPKEGERNRPKEGDRGGDRRPENPDRSR